MTRTELEQAIAQAHSQKLLLDQRKLMPHPKGESWPLLQPWDRLGVCIHHTGTKGQDPLAIARYHTSSENHITPGTPLPGICYCFAIPDTQDPPWLCEDLLSRTWAQADPNTAGDENRALIPIVVMGGFRSRDYPELAEGPSKAQMTKLWALIAWLEKLFSFNDSAIFCHSDFSKGSCPGDLIYSEVLRLRNKYPPLTDAQWQQAILKWNPQALPKFRADGSWGEESKYWLAKFQQAHRLKSTGARDPMTQLKALQYLPAPTVDDLYETFEAVSAVEVSAPREPIEVPVLKDSIGGFCRKCGNTIGPQDQHCKGGRKKGCPYKLPPE